MANEDILARNSILDGLRLTYAYQDAVVAQQRYTRIMDALEQFTGMDRIALENYVKYRIITSGKGGGQKLEAYFIGGKVSKRIPREWLDKHIRNVTEVQTKFYLVQGGAVGHETFIDAYYYSRGGKFSSSFYDGKSGRGRSEPGYRSLAISTQKSDVHVTVKRYRGERTGVESHVKGKVLRSIVTDAIERAHNRNASGDETGAFSEVQHQASRRGARRFLRALRSRGIALGEYFEGVSPVSWLNPLHDKDFAPIDEEEERQGAAFGEIEGFIGKADQQLSFMDDDAPSEE